MKQELGTPSTPDNQAKPVKAKPEKDLYKPYKMPPFLWTTIRVLVKIVFAIMARVHLSGLENVPAEGPFIIASNHLSWFDVPLIPAYFSRPVIYMAKEETFQGRIGWLVRFLGAFPVKRGEADRQALRTADEQLKEGNIIVIFPEGTRSKTHTMARGHSGLGMIALRSGVPVLPVAISGSEKLLKKFRPRVTITYGQPMILKPKGQKVTREDVDAATEQVMHRIAEMLPPQYRGAYNIEQQQGS
jgi:1-acyl-sn-glycerol-3-phosphate acyltransferase